MDDRNYINTFHYIKNVSIEIGVPINVISRDCRHLVKKHNKYKYVWIYLDEYEQRGWF